MASTKKLKFGIWIVYALNLDPFLGLVEIELTATEL